MWTQPDADGAGGSNNNGSSVAPGNASPGDMITGDELAAGAVAVAGRDMPSVDATSGATTGTEDIEFIVQYGKVNNMTMYETVAKLENVSIYRGWTMVATLSAQNFSTAKLNSLLAPPSSPPVSWQAKLFFSLSGQAQDSEFKLELRFTHTMGHFICIGDCGRSPYYDLPFGPKC